MPKIKDVKPFRRLPNVEILNWTRRFASTDYQARVPEATKANMETVMDAIFNYAPDRNVFINSMVNKIGLSRASASNFSNPLKNLKREWLNYGDTFEETFIGLVEAEVYDADRDQLERVIFGRRSPESMTVFHKVTRRERYVITIDTVSLKRAFQSEYGLSDFIDKLMNAPTVSDEWDEFTQMSQLFREYYDRGGYFIVNVPDVSDLDSDAAQARALTRRIRSYAENLKFISRYYNAAGMPVAANADDLILFTTPEAQAAIDVEALAAAFNVSKADVPFRTEVLPKDKLNIPGVQAILTTRSLLVVMDQVYETRSVENPAGLYENFFLHHHSVMSISPFAPAILFSSVDADTEIPTEDTPVTSIENAMVIDIEADEPMTALDEVQRGRFYQVLGEAATTPEGGFNDAVRLSLTGNVSEFTKLTNTGSLFIGANEEAESLTITVTSVDEPTISSELTVTVTGDRWGLWPDNGWVQPEAEPEPDPEPEG